MTHHDPAGPDRPSSRRTVVLGVLAVAVAAFVGASVLLPVRGAPHVLVRGGSLGNETLATGVESPGPTAAPSASGGASAFVPPARQTPAAGVPRNVRVTRDSTSASYARADGTRGETMANCSTGRREQNEPTVAIDPHRPSVVVAGANDYCTTVSTEIG